MRCIDCDRRLVNSRAKRCKLCYGKSITISDTYKCIDCEKVLSGKIYKRCRPCYMKTAVGTRAPSFRNAGIVVQCNECGVDVKRFKSTVSKSNFCSMACRSKYFTGVRNPRFKKDKIMRRVVKSIRGTPQYISLRDSVFKRDNYSCLFPSCDGNIRYLNAHHIEKMSDIIKKNKIQGRFDSLKVPKMWDEKNLITLCKDCHIHIQGKESQYYNLFSLIINKIY